MIHYFPRPTFDYLNFDAAHYPEHPILFLNSTIISISNLYTAVYLPA
jgi:hypothetical protein